MKTKPPTSDRPVSLPQAAGATKRRSPTSWTLGKGSDAETNRRAAAILDVLAGMRTPSEAAVVLNITVARYYALERRALEGLLAALRARPKRSPTAKAEQQVAVLQRELDRCRQECQRQAALVRATQRAVGLSPVPVGKPGGKSGKKKGKPSRRRRRPTVRALRAAEALRKNSSGLEARSALEPTIRDRASEAGPPSTERKESPHESRRTQAAGSGPCE